MPLLSDSDRPYDISDNGGMGEGMGKDRSKQGTETSESIGIV